MRTIQGVILHFAAEKQIYKLTNTSDLLKYRSTNLNVTASYMYN